MGPTHVPVPPRSDRTITLSPLSTETDSGPVTFWTEVWFVPPYVYTRRTSTPYPAAWTRTVGPYEVFSQSTPPPVRFVPTLKYQYPGTSPTNPVVVLYPAAQNDSESPNM